MAKRIFMVAWILFSVFAFSYLNINLIRDSKGQPFFNSPDEAINYWASTMFARGSFRPLIYIPEYHKEYKYLDSRSTFLVESSIIAPGGFLGMPFITGILSRIINLPDAIIYFSPVLAGLLILAIYFLSVNFFTPRIALLSFFSAALIPPILYYSNRGMFHNISFTALWLAGLTLFFISMKDKNHGKKLLFVLSSLFFVSSVLIRPSEIIWIIIGLLVYTALMRKSISLPRIAILIFCLIAAAAGYFIVHKLMFSRLGYAITAQSGSAFDFFSYLFPFGLHPRIIFFNIYHILFKNLWWVTVPALLGIIFWIKDGVLHDKNQRALFISMCVSFLWLIIVYGSWRTYDTPRDFNAVTIGDAHMRYWLPIFASMLPFVFFFFERVSNFVRFNIYFLFLSIYLAAFVFFSYNFTFRGVDGLIAVKANLKEGASIIGTLEKNAGEKDLVLTNHEDKFVFGRYYTTRRLDLQTMARMFQNDQKFFAVAADNDSVWKNQEKQIKEFGFNIRETERLPRHTIYEVIER